MGALRGSPTTPYVMSGSCPTCCQEALGFRVYYFREIRVEFLEGCIRGGVAEPKTYVGFAAYVLRFGVAPLVAEHKDPPLNRHEIQGGPHGRGYLL